MAYQFHSDYTDSYMPWPLSGQLEDPSWNAGNWLAKPMGGGQSGDPAQALSMAMANYQQARKMGMPHGAALAHAINSIRQQSLPMDRSSAPAQLSMDQTGR